MQTETLKSHMSFHKKKIVAFIKILCNPSMKLFVKREVWDIKINDHT